MPYDAVFIVEAVIRAGIVCAADESVHLVLVEVHHTDAAVIIFIINIVCAGLAVCSFIFHISDILH